MQTRQTPRKVIALPARYTTGPGVAVDVVVTDISPGGCRFVATPDPISKGTALQIYIAGTGPHHGSVKWMEDGNVGVTFTRKLTPALMGEFQSSHMPVDAQTFEYGDFDPMEKTSTQPRRFC